MCSGRSTTGSAPCGCGCSGGRSVDESAEPAWPSAGRIFDEIVYREADPNALLPASGGGHWEVLARPRDTVSWTGGEALLIERALGEGHLAHARTIAAGGDAGRWVDADGRVPANVLLLGRRPARTAPRLRHTAGDVADLPAIEADGAEDTPGLRAEFFPPRDASAPAGRAFMARIAGERAPADPISREEQIVAALTSGNMPDRLLRWVPITLTHQATSGPITGTVRVLPDYLSVGNDADFVRVPLDAVSAQRVADAFKVMLPTARICHAIYEQTPARQRVNAIQRDYYLADAARRTAARGRDQTSTAAYLEHSEAIQARMTTAGLTFGELVAGHKKDVVIARRLHTTPDHVAFQGFYDGQGFPFEPCYENAERRPRPDCRKDNPTLAHTRRFSDYAQGVRLLHPWMIVNGRRRTVADVLADPELSALISSEGPIVPPRIPAGPGPASRRATREALDEDIPRSGRGAFRHDPLGGDDGDNVALRWNVDGRVDADARIDVVLHLHGFGAPGAAFLSRKADAAGLDLRDTSGGTTVGRPTLAVVPRGNHRSGVEWRFERLATPAALDAMLEAALRWLETTALGRRGASLRRGRLAIHAHSGGGAGLSTLLASGVDPDEVVCFDSVYGGLDPIRSWADAKLSTRNPETAGLRVFYTGCSAPDPAQPGGVWAPSRSGHWEYRAPGSWRYWASDNRWHLITTEVNARRLAAWLDRRLGAGSALAARYRVQQALVPHDEIPARYALTLVRGVTATVPNAQAPPPLTQRPRCVANSNWLDHPPEKPGGTSPPPPKPDTPPSSARAPALTS